MDEGGLKADGMGFIHRKLARIDKSNIEFLVIKVPRCMNDGFGSGTKADRFGMVAVSPDVAKAEMEQPPAVMPGRGTL